MSVYQQLKKMNIVLPDSATPAAAYLMSQQSGQFIYLSGHLAKKEGKIWAGKLGKELTTQQGADAARLIAIDLLATLNQHTQNKLDQIRLVKLMCLVNSTPDFTDQHLVANGASEFFVKVLGDQGKHARSAFGVAQIPMSACVEIELIAQYL